MPTVKDEKGEVVAKMEYTPEGEAQAEKMVEDNLGYTITNAPDIRENYQLGGLVPGQQGFGQRPVVNPLTIGQNPMVKPPLGNVKKPLGMYEEGGEVEYKKGGKVKK
jgi:hypothetical protein